MCSASSRFILGFLAVLLAAALLCSEPARAGQTSARLEASRRDAGADLALLWPEAVTTAVEHNGRELTLRFSRPLGDVALEGVPERLRGWVDNVLYGYDSVLLVLPPGIVAKTARVRSGVRVAFAAETLKNQRSAAAEAADRAVQRRIDYFRAFTMMEGGQLREARPILRDLLLANPRDAQSTALLGQAEERLGRWREALRAYDTALELTPNEPSLVTAKAVLLHEHGDRLRFDVDHQHVRNADVQRIAKLSGLTDIGWSTSLTYGLESRRVDVDAVRRQDGGSSPFHGDRQRLDMDLVHDWPELQRSTLSLFAAPHTLGVGYGHAWRDEESETRTGFAWSEPNFAFLEGIVGGGRRDRVFLQHDERLSEWWSLTFGAGYNRYGLSDAVDLVRSATLEGSLRYVLNQEGPLTSVAYVLDAEYVGRRVERQTEEGLPFAPLPAATREIHAIQVNIEDRLTDYVRYGLQAGYAYDRRGKSGPQGSLSLGWEPADQLEIGFRAGHARSTTRGTASAVNSMGGYVILRH